MQIDKSIKLNVLVLGSGGREHTIVRECLKSENLNSIICAPGNAGIEKIAKCFKIDACSSEAVLSLVKENNINFVIIGPEAPLSVGIADVLRQNNIACYGPDKNGAMLEASKAYSKDFLKKYSIPTASGENFTSSKEACDYIEKFCQGGKKVVIKASGLAAGKGVVLPETVEEAKKAAKEMLEEAAFGDSGKEIVVEEFMEGEEASIMLMVCGKNYYELTASQDHKRIGENDQGLNTGGMGAYTPAACVTNEISQKVRKEIVEPTLAGIEKEGVDYRGTLYVGIMITPENEVKVVEFNCRFGDPECEVLLPLVDGNLLLFMYSIGVNKIDLSLVKKSPKYCTAVVISSKGYPEYYEKDEAISLPEDDESSWVIHCGTKSKDGKILTAGGRVLACVGIADTLEGALKNSYEKCNGIKFEGAYFRKDIAHRQLKRNKQ